MSPLRIARWLFGFLTLSLVSLDSHAYKITLNRRGSCGHWKSSSYKWDTHYVVFKNSNDWGGLFPDGDNRRGSIQHDFCTGEVSSIPVGSYCFYRNRRETGCPQGFTPGTRTQTLDGLDSTGHADDRPATTGSLALPTFHFCCGDGDPSTVISFDAIRHELPDQFTLFRKDKNCQQINGRSVEDGWVFWDDLGGGFFSSAGNKNARSGTLPSGEYGEDTKMFYCSYSASSLPDPVKSISVETLTSTSASISWIPSDSQATFFKLELMNSYNLVSTKEISANAFVYDNLEKATTYSVTVFSGTKGGSQYETVGRKTQFTTELPSGTSWSSVVVSLFLGLFILAYFSKALRTTGSSIEPKKEVPVREEATEIIDKQIVPRMEDEVKTTPISHRPNPSILPKSSQLIVHYGIASFEISISLKDTVDSLKVEVENLLKISSDNFLLTCAGSILEDGKILSISGVEHRDLVFVTARTVLQ